MIVESEAGSATFYGDQPDRVVEDMPMYLRLLFRASRLHDFSVEFLVPHGEAAPRVSMRRFILICDEISSPVPDLGPLGYDLSVLIPDLRAAHAVVIIGGEPTLEAYATACVPLMKNITTVSVLIETTDDLVDVWLRTALAARSGCPENIIVFRGHELPLAVAS